MSSFTRTIQKRGLRRLGYHRQTTKWIIINDTPQIVPCHRGEGNILNKDGGDTGSTRYPVLLPKVKAETSDA